MTRNRASEAIFDAFARSDYYDGESDSVDFRDLQGTEAVLVSGIRALELYDVVAQALLRMSWITENAEWPQRLLVGTAFESLGSDPRVAVAVHVKVLREWGMRYRGRERVAEPELMEATNRVVRGSDGGRYSDRLSCVRQALDVERMLYAPLQAARKVHEL